MSDPFKTHAHSVTGPALGAYAITPSDSTNLTDTIRAVTVGGQAGTLSFISARDGVTYTTASLPIGTYAVFASRILATNTTATGLTGWV